jgi:hypothetical protein
MEEVFEVNTESLLNFLKTYLTNPPDERDSRISDYYRLKDELICKKTLPVKFGGLVKISLLDSNNSSGRKLIHNYTYAVHAYDSISVSLILTNFNVSASQDKIA